MIVFYCVNPSCGKRFRADEKLAGRLARCTKCNLTLRVPQPDGSPQSLDHDPGDFYAASTPRDQPLNPAPASTELDEQDEDRGVHPALRWLGGILAIATLLGVGYWWLGQPSSQQEESFKNYIRTSEELVEMHKAITSDSDLAQTRKKLFDKAQENLDAWRKIQEITGRKRASLDETYANELRAASSKRFDLVKDYTMSDSMRMLVFWGRTGPQGVAFFESSASGEYKVLSLERGNPGATPSKPPSVVENKGSSTPVDPPVRPVPKEIEKEKPNPVALKKQIIGLWVSVANKSQSIEFLANGTGVILESNGAIKATFYDFVTDDTIQYADSSERVKLKLDGDQLEVTNSMGKAIKYRREKVVEPPTPSPSVGKGKTEAELPQPKKEPISLQGNWEINRVVIGNNIVIKSDSDKPPSVTFKHDKDAATGTCTVQGIANSPGGKAYFSFIALPASSRFKFDTKGEALAIDLTPDRGKKLEGICKFEDANTLVICLSTLARPKEYDTTKEPKDGYRVLITLKRKPL